MRRTVFLDRDGVLNRAPVWNGKPESPTSVEEFEILPGVREACEMLHNSGFLLVVVTNQPDVTRGRQTRELVDTLHAALRKEVPVDDVRVCFHDDADGCDCRKPRPGLLLAAARSWQIDLGASFMVGDRWRDIDAGRAAGCRTVLIDYPYDEVLRQEPHWRAASLRDAALWIVKQG